MILHATSERTHNRGPRSKCGNCGKPACTKKCQRCMALYYCSRDCQKNHWRAEHRRACNIYINADPSSILRSFAKGVNENYGRIQQSHHHEDNTMPTTMAAVQRLFARVSGQNQGNILWNMVKERVLSPTWSMILEMMKHVIRGHDDSSTFYFITVPPTSVLVGSGAEYWTLALTYQKDFDSYHLALSDHVDGIQKRVKHLCCTATNEVAPVGLNKFKGEDLLVVFTDDDKELRPYLRVDWATGEVIHDTFGQ